MLSLVKNEVPSAGSMQEDAQNQKRFRLAQLLRDTEEILFHAQSRDWATVETMEKARQRELAICFAESGNDDSPLIAEALATLIHMNERITQLVREARDELVDEQRVRETRHQAATHYETF